MTERLDYVRYVDHDETQAVNTAVQLTLTYEQPAYVARVQWHWLFAVAPNITKRISSGEPLLIATKKASRFTRFLFLRFAAQQLAPFLKGEHDHIVNEGEQES